MKTEIKISSLAIAVFLALGLFAVDAQARNDDKNLTHVNANVDLRADADTDTRPAGWDRGKKTGWDDKDTPPGQYRKMDDDEDDDDDDDMDDTNS